MAGLFDFSQYDNPEAAGQLAFSAGLLDAAGPQRLPVSTGQALAQALMLGRNTATVAAMNQRRNALVDIQLMQTLQALQQAQQKNALTMAFLNRLGLTGTAAEKAPQQSPLPLNAGPLNQDMSPVSAAMRVNAVTQQNRQAQPAPQSSQSFPFSLNEVLAAKELGLPDMGEMYRWSNTPQERKAGSFYQPPNGGPMQFIPDIKLDSQGRAVQTQYGPDGYRVSVPPGALDAAQAYQTLANKNDIITWKDPKTGQEMRGTKDDYLRATGQVSQAPAPTAEGGMSGDRFKRYRDLLARSGVNLSPQETKDLADLEREFSGGPRGIAAGPTASTQATFKSREEQNTVFNTKLLPAAMESSDSANSLLTSVSVARKALPTNGGWTAPVRAAVAQFFAGTGMAPDAVNQVAASAEIFRQAGATRLWEVLNAAKGPQTEGDASRAKQTFAQLGNTRQANEFILDLLEAIATRDRQRAQFYQAAIPLANERGSDLMEIPREWNRLQKSVFDMPSMQRWK